MAANTRRSRTHWPAAVADERIEIMKLKINDQIPDVKIFHLVDGEPKEQNMSEVLGSKAFYIKINI